MTDHDLDGPDWPLTVTAWCVAAAATLSGPVSAIVTIYDGAAHSYAGHTQWLQQTSLWIGFALEAASILLVVRMASLAFDRHRTRSLLSIVIVAIYAAVITVSFALQLASLPVPTTAATAPASVLGIVGYGILGIAMAILAEAIPSHTRRKRAIRWLLRGNGVLSLTGVMVTESSIGWAQTSAGLAGFVGWNVMIVASMLLIGLEYMPPKPRAI
jgi:hypothetical protein